MALLNYADNVRIGSVQPSAAYLGATKVWPFKPTDLSGCAIWLDATKLNLTNGATVSSWTNLGSGSQPTITGTPTFQTNALNSRPVVRITQGSGKFRWYSGTGVDLNWTLVYIARCWQMRGGRVITAFSTAANLLVGFHGGPSGTYQMDQCYVEGWLTSGTYPTRTTNWKLYSADSTSVAVARFFINGVLSGTGAATPAKGWGNTFCISGYTDDAAVATSQECDCDIAEVVLYNRKLSDAERVQVESYLRIKWLRTTPFSPNNLYADLLGWYDASDVSTIVISGSGMSQWSAKAGGMVLQQFNDSYKPTYANQTVNFSGSQIFTALGPPATGCDVIFVGRPKPATAPSWRTLIRNATNPHLIIIEQATTRYGTYNAGFFQAGGLTWDNVWGLGYGRFGDNAVTFLSRDAGALTSTGTTIAAGSAIPSYLGSYPGTPPDQPWGDIKEIIYLPYNYQDSTRQMLESYLAFKWGLDGLLPAGHPYKSAPPVVTI